MLYLLAIVFPPLAVLFCGKPFQFLLNLLLCLFFWLPGVLHALAVVANRYADKRVDRIIRAQSKIATAYSQSVSDATHAAAYQAPTHAAAQAPVQRWIPVPEARPIHVAAPPAERPKGAAGAAIRLRIRAATDRLRLAFRALGRLGAGGIDRIREAVQAGQDGVYVCPACGSSLKTTSGKSMPDGTRIECPACGEICTISNSRENLA